MQRRFGEGKSTYYRPIVNNHFVIFMLLIFKIDKLEDRPRKKSHLKKNHVRVYILLWKVLCENYPNHPLIFVSHHFNYLISLLTISVIQILTGYHISPPIFLTTILIQYLPNSYQNGSATNDVILSFMEM